ncbi:hypothetical protein [Lacinutrix sp. Hel_I_90]|uniref:hypothetical protein n=1 Tax=Lacinutrix sp. Hel_I_90 TaxID=1249999 RepID=UPI0005C9C561|nr:hypothetical protein [Lacinutrix sp. Hel_I_90]
MKNTYIKLLALILIASVSVSCVNDDETFGVSDTKAIATTTVTSITVPEGSTGVIPFTLSKALNKASQFKIELMSGSASQEEIMVGDQETDADTGIPGEGFEITVPAYQSSFEIPFESLLDFDCEANENVKIRITAAGVRTAITPDSDGYIIDVAIPNVPTWTIVGVDTYGDSWNGASIDVTIDGVTTSYTVEEDTNTYYVGIPTGATYSFAFVSGDWDGEVEYTITSPDGDVFADAYYPAVGQITSGTSSCN